MNYQEFWTAKMRIFLVLLAAHWLEHLFQAYQVYVLYLHRECALGFLGMKYPWLIRTEALHFVFALLTVVGFFWVSDWGFWDGKSIRFWRYGYRWSIWHLFEHTLLFAQALTHHNLFGRPAPISILQLIFPRIELHLFYNSIITVYVLMALLQDYLFKRDVRKQLNGMEIDHRKEFT